MPKTTKQLSIVKPFSRSQRKELPELREQVDGAELLIALTKELESFDKIDSALEDSIQTQEREIYNEEGELVRTEQYTTTLLDKETIAVYHTMQNGRKIKMDTLLKLLNKILPDLKAVDDTNDLGGASERALLAFKKAAQK